MATERVESAAARFNEIRREWGLQNVDEATAQAQLTALTPLMTWLQSGDASPEVVIRAVQTLLADPERPGIDKHPAVKQVSRQVAGTWANAGLGAPGLLGLQAMILSAWPYEKEIEWFRLVPLFNSAWSAVGGRTHQQATLEAWRAEAETAGTLGQDDSGTEMRNPHALPTPKPPDDVSADLAYLRQHKNTGWNLSNFGPQLVSVLDAYQKAISEILNWEGAMTAAMKGVEDKALALARGSHQMEAEKSLLWWGQARYCKSLRKPYRKLSSEERIWWMAWEASELAQGVRDVEPAAAFLVETVRQLDGDVDSERRPIKEWLRLLVTVLSRSNERDLDYVGASLKQIAEEDSLGLPVTWARLHAKGSAPSSSEFEERANQDISLDLDLPISRGDWAEWLFREALLDRSLGGK